MEKTTKTKPTRRCPKCKREYTAEPAISRKDNKTEICPSCGLIEALEDFRGRLEKEKDEALKLARKTKRMGTLLKLACILITMLCSFSAGLCVKQGDWVFFIPNISLIIINLIHFKKLLD